MDLLAEVKKTSRATRLNVYMVIAEHLDETGAPLAWVPDPERLLAERSAVENGLPWPPSIEAAEEFLRRRARREK